MRAGPLRRTLRLLPILLALQPACVAGSAGQTDQERGFAELVRDLSEPGGYFDTDNLISNEASYLHVMRVLEEEGVSGGAYLGVGPAQNFSYIASIQPAVAVIVDIRRDNMLLHLLFKALFELADDRGDYLALLTGRSTTGAAGPPGEPVDSLVARIDALPPDPLATAAARRLADSAIATFGVPLAAPDRAAIARFHHTFIAAGLSLRFRSYGRAPQPYYPTLRQLILERDLTGRQASFLATDERFLVVKRLQEADGVIPITGDFAGGHALPAIADEIRRRGLEVMAFYTSNVEFYLVRQGQFAAFVGNVAALPVADNAVIIRSVFRGPFGQRDPRILPGYGSVQLVADLGWLVEGYRQGAFRSYWDVVAERPARP